MSYQPAIVVTWPSLETSLDRLPPCTSFVVDTSTVHVGELMFPLSRDGIGITVHCSFRIYFGRTYRDHVSLTEVALNTLSWRLRLATLLCVLISTSQSLRMN